MFCSHCPQNLMLFCCCAKRVFRNRSFHEIVKQPKQPLLFHGITTRISRNISQNRFVKNPIYTLSPQSATSVVKKAAIATEQGKLKIVKHTQMFEKHRIRSCFLYKIDLSCHNAKHNLKKESCSWMLFLSHMFELKF
jgi:hypothetical protein